MKCFVLKFVFFAAMVFLCACRVDSTSSKSLAPLETPQIISADDKIQPAKPENYDASIFYFDDVYTDGDSLSDGAYQIEKRSKMFWIKDAEVNAEVTYAVLKRGGKIINKFEGVQNPLGNDARFALFPVLGRKSKQLIVEETAWREWRHWVVDLSGGAKVIYDSGDYSVGQSLRAVDIDGDGKNELIQSLLAFWFFDRLTNVDSPFVDIIFAYNPAQKKYLPANARFQEFALRNIKDDIRKVAEIRTDSNAPGQDGGKFGAILNVVLTYIYAGKEREAWAFYENEYNLADKEEMKTKIKDVLGKDEVYKTIKK